MSSLGYYDMSFPGISTSGGSSSGSSAGSSAGSGSSAQDTRIVPGMLGVYSQLLGINQQNYGNMRNAYQQQLAGNAQALPGIYNQFSTGVNHALDALGVSSNGQLNGSWGVAAPAAQGIQNVYNQTVAGNTQQMASAGLGNTTVGASMNSQAAQQAALSYGQLGSQLATQASGVIASGANQLLSGQLQGQQMQTGLTSAALNPLDTQMANTAGTLTGGFGQSSYSNSSQQRSQQQGQQQQSGQTGAQSPNPGSNVTGAPGGPAGGGGSGSGSGTGGGGTGSGMEGVPGYNPVGAYGGGGNNVYNQGTSPNGPGGPQTIDNTNANDPGNYYNQVGPDSQEPQGGNADGNFPGLSPDQTQTAYQYGLPPGSDASMVALAQQAEQEQGGDGSTIQFDEQVSPTEARFYKIQNDGSKYYFVVGK